MVETDRTITHDIRLDACEFGEQTTLLQGEKRGMLFACTDAVRGHPSASWWAGNSNY